MKLYKGESDGEVVIETSAKDVNDLIVECATTMAQLIAEPNDSWFSCDTEHFLASFFYNLFPLAFKVAGYKSEKVYEERILISGFTKPGELYLDDGMQGARRKRIVEEGDGN